MVHDGIGMVAKAIGAYTINVPGRGVQPRQGKLLAETFRRRAGDAQALIPQPYHLYLTRAVELSTPQYAQLPERTIPLCRSQQNGMLAPRNGTALLRGSPTVVQASRDVGRHGVGKL